MNNRPSTADYPPYYHKYVERVKTNDGLETLTQSLQDTLVFLAAIPLEKWDYSYDVSKWTLKESWLHLIDSERVFAYRALRIGRGDETPLAGFDQDDYVPNSNAANRTPESIVEEYKSVRETTIQLFKHFDATAWSRMGTASGGKVSVNALAFIIAGHEAHHVALTKERYL
ncbi:MAG: DinB family protein [Bacteroidota bacterium]